MTLIRSVPCTSILVGTLCLASCASSPRVVKSATDAQRAVLLDSIKELEGTWTTVDQNGQTVTASVFSVSSAGSVVREIMFPGQAHEMTNVYHMDGDSLVMTHYCAAGNQPRLRARPGPSPHVIAFTLDDVSNLTRANEHYMGGLTLTKKDDNTLIAHWTSYNGPAGDESMDFVLSRAR